MSRKTICPGCDSYTSEVQAAYDYEEPCPNCGLPYEATAAVLAARKNGADEGLIRRALDAETRAAAAVKANRQLLGQLDRLKELATAALTPEDSLSELRRRCRS